MIRKSIIGVDPPSSFAKYYEYMGGLGDVFLRLKSSSWYASLDRLAPDERAAVVLMCHNPNAAQLFEWHPKIAQIEVFDLGYDGHKGHPWDDLKWRAAHQLPAGGLCPPPHDGTPLRFYPSPADLEIIASFEANKFVVMCPAAGTPERTIPPSLADAVAFDLIKMGFTVVEAGAGVYLNRQFGPMRSRSGLISLVDKLSVPGTIELIRKARGLVTAISFPALAAWYIEKPVCLLYPQAIKDKYVTPRFGMGYFYGLDYATTVHAENSTYHPDLLKKWVGT